MDVWAEKIRLKTAAVILLAVLLSSCAPRQVIVVSDPYIDNLYSGVWGPSSRLFAIKARLSGIQIKNFKTDQEITLSTVIETAGSSDIVVLSPWNTASPGPFPVLEGRYIAAGAAPAESPNVNTSYIAADRSAAISEIAVLSAGIASHSGKNALAILNATTPTGKREKQLLFNDFQIALTESGDTVELVILDIAEEEGNRLPSDFKDMASESSVLLLLAGPFNLTALTESGDSSIPVITENLGPSTAWKERIVASIEDNPKAMMKVLMSQLNSEAPEEQEYYPARLVKGDLYGSQSR